MLHTNQFGKELKKLGFAFYSGVPCSLLKDLINFAINECEYVMATNEGEAVSLAAGAYLGGKKSVVLMQNSGLTNACSPLTSLNYPFKIPILGFVGLRGEPGYPDEPQHELMGQITCHIMETMQIKWEFLSNDFEKARLQLIHAHSVIEKNQSFFFVVKRNTFAEEPLLEQKNKCVTDQLPTRYEALQIIHSLKDSQTIYLATTGKTGRELYDLDDVPNNLYMVGSMGCINSLGLGLALTRKDKNIIVIDGDGALLMRMGNLATNGYYRPPNMLHILLDNHSHDSTGGQSTVSHNVNFVNIAAACGYEQSVDIHNLKELEECIRTWKNEKKLTFLYLKIAKGSKKGIGRPKIKPDEVKQRLQVFLDD